jgi:hypothetical protein
MRAYKSPPMTVMLLEGFFLQMDLASPDGGTVPDFWAAAIKPLIFPEAQLQKE